MIRDRWHLRVSDVESWNECERLCDELNKLFASKGWTQGTFWTPKAGPWGEMIMEFDYTDLATMQKEDEELFADPEFNKLFTEFNHLSREESFYNELLQTA